MAKRPVYAGHSGWQQPTLQALTKATALSLLMVFVGVVPSLMPPVASLESDMGLDWLFQLRGPRPAPEEVIVVAMDRESSDWLGLPNKPSKWPRSLHAQLVRELARQGAGIIAFDMHFAEAKDAKQDRMFADAMREAGNVVLFEYLTWEKSALPGNNSTSGAYLTIEKRVPPIPELARAAAALAPFPLPKVPVKVSQFWLYKGEAGDVPTLPVAAFSVFARPFYDELLRLLGEVAPKEVEWIAGDTAISKGKKPIALAGNLWQLFQDNPPLVQRLQARLQDGTAPADPVARSTLAALFRMHDGRYSHYFDFYGPPRSIHTVPYYRVLEGRLEDRSRGGPVDLEGKAVFVGFSEERWLEQKDGFHTVFSLPEGLDLSGVEIAATAFANLLEGRSIEPLEPPHHFLLIALWGIALGTLFLLLPAAGIFPAVGVLAGAYLGTAHYAFAHHGLWLPMVVPLLFQLPLALLGALLVRYLYNRRVRQKIHACLSYYVPGGVVNELILSRDMTTKEQLVHGICLATDAEQYTRLSETLEPDQLRALLNQYYQAIFEPVRRRGGFISDVIGDAMVAIWAMASADRALREQACHAALEIIAVVDAFTYFTPEVRLPTRIGLHWGKMVLGNVGGRDHFEYRAVGDIVNAATRIEGLNKQLGTRVLASREVIEGLDGLVTREVGSFRLVGKSKALVIHELLPPTAPTDAGGNVYASFAAALETFRLQRWPEAKAAFQALLARCPDDGPSRYYLRLCEQYAMQPPAVPWDGVVTLGRK